MYAVTVRPQFYNSLTPPPTLIYHLSFEAFLVRWTKEREKVKDHNIEWQFHKKLPP